MTTLYSFCSLSLCMDGFFPVGGVILALDGNFYGTTRDGGSNKTCGNGYGCGTVFKLTPEGILTTLYSFDGLHGEDPESGLVEGNRRQLVWGDSIWRR